MTTGLLQMQGYYKCQYCLYQSHAGIIIWLLEWFMWSYCFGMVPVTSTLICEPIHSVRNHKALQLLLLVGKTHQFISDILSTGWVFFMLTFTHIFKYSRELVDPSWKFAPFMTWPPGYDKVSMFSLTSPHKPLRKIKWPSGITRLTAHFTSYMVWCLIWWFASI